MSRVLNLKWSRKKTAAAVILLAVLGLVIFIKAITGPSVGTIQTSSSNDSPGQTYESLNGENFSLSYPSNYRLENTGQHAINILESYRLVAAPARGGLSRVAAVTIYEVPGGSLYEVSAYKSRKDKPGEYTEQIKHINGNQVNLITDTKTSEQVAFIQNGNMVATIAFSGGVAQDGAGEEYNGILNSWEWQ